MTASRPGILASFTPSFVRAAAQFLRSRRAVVLVLALSVPPILALPIATRNAEVRTEALAAIVVFVYLQFLLPITGLVFGTGVLLDEASAGALPYLFTRPSPRSGILLGKVVAYWLLGSAALALSLGGFILLCQGATPGDPLPARAFLAVLAAFPAYLALFTVLGVFTRWALVGGFFYAFGLEGFLGVIPGLIRKSTLLYYSRSLLGPWEARRFRPDLVLGPGGAATDGTSLTVLGVTAFAAMVLAAWVLSRRQFVPRTAARD